ncbi:MAG: pyruvate dehydrogenase (acetyl-transferring) E1 component subunit alpha [Alphaproteobacteria bacterium]
MVKATKKSAPKRGTATKAAPKSKTAAKTNNLANFSKEQLLKMYHDMLLIRRFEEKAGQLYGMGLIGGFCHLYIGQEAVVVGMQSAAQPQDSVVTSYRDHGHMLACDMEANGIMAELTGREGGYSKGKGGSMHMFSREKNFFGGHGIVGAQVPIGAGLAFGHKYANDNGVAMAYYGDGASNQGQVAETYNMAQIWDLPIIFVIENNQYGMGTSVARASANTDLHRRGEPYDIPGEAVNGMDVLEVYAAALRALEHCRSGKGPYILEMKTYRYRGHSMSDPAKYRSREEVAKMREERDPIDHLREQLEQAGLLSEAEAKEIDKEIKKVVLASAEFAQTSPEPSEAELWTDITSD